MKETMLDDENKYEQDVDPMYYVQNAFGAGVCVYRSQLFQPEWPQTKKGTSIMIVTATLDKKTLPTEDQIKEIKEASEKQIVYDEDSPALTDAMRKAFVLAANIQYII